MGEECCTFTDLEPKEWLALGRPSVEEEGACSPSWMPWVYLELWRQILEVRGPASMDWLPSA